MKVAITGANGFVGSSLTRYLMKRNYEVSSLVRKTANVSLLPVKAKVVEIDYSSEESIQSGLADQEIVIHCAALTRADNWDEMKEINVTLTEKVIEAVNKTGSVRQLIFLSSQAAAGMGSFNKPKTEEEIAQPVTWYGKSKLMAEELIRSRTQKDWTIVRPVSVYGPGDKDFLQTFKLMKNHLSVSLGIKDKYISLIYIDELCQMITKCIDNKSALGQVFFASDGNIYTHKMFADAMQNAVHTFSLHIAVPDALAFTVSAFGELRNKFQPKSSIFCLQKFKEMQGRFWTVSIDKPRRLLGFEPKPNLTHHLHTTWIWYKEQGWL